MVRVCKLGKLGLRVVPRPVKQGTTHSHNKIRLDGPVFLLAGPGHVKIATCVADTLLKD